MFRMGRDLTRAGGDSKDLAKSYRRACLDVRCKFVLVNTRMDMWWHEYNVREKLGRQSQAMCQTAYQRICGVARIIQDIAANHGRASATPARTLLLDQERACGLDQLLDVSSAGAAAIAEVAAESFIRECFSVHEHMFSVEGVELAIKTLDMKLGHNSPLDSVYKLGQIRTVCQSRTTGSSTSSTNNLIQWVKLALVDNIMVGVESVQSISTTDMKPGRSRCLVGLMF